MSARNACPDCDGTKRVDAKRCRPCELARRHRLAELNANRCTDCYKAIRPWRLRCWDCYNAWRKAEAAASPARAAISGAIVSQAERAAERARQRLEIIEDFHDIGRSALDAANALGISVAAMQRWLYRHGHDDLARWAQPYLNRSEHAA